jgi:hypothetical protein
MVEFKRHSGLKVGESRLMLVRKVSSGVCEYAQAEAGCNGPMAVARELRRVTPDRCMEAAVRVAELCQEAADALERTIPTEGEARDHAEALRSKARILRNDSYGASADVCEKAASYIERTAQGVTPAVVHEVLAMVDGIARDEERQGDDALWTEGYRIMIETCREALAALNPKPEVSK